MSYAHHGNRTDQFKKTAAMISIVTSVMNALPLRKNTPATAGSKARSKGAEFHNDSSLAESAFTLLLSWSPSISPDALGKNKLPVEDRIELRVSDTVSDIVELRR